MEGLGRETDLFNGPKSVALIPIGEVLNGVVGDLPAFDITRFGSLFHRLVSIEGVHCIPATSLKRSFTNVAEF